MKLSRRKFEEKKRLIEDISKDMGEILPLFYLRRIKHLDMQNYRDGRIVFHWDVIPADAKYNRRMPDDAIAETQYPKDGVVDILLNSRLFRKLLADECLTTIAHELVHAIQFRSADTNVVNARDDKLPYEDQEAEKEAYHWEAVGLKEYKQNTTMVDKVRQLYDLDYFINAHEPHAPGMPVDRAKPERRPMVRRETDV